jgi:hypothetical protein
VAACPCTDGNEPDPKVTLFCLFIPANKAN